MVFIISPLLKRLYRRSSYLRYNQYKHCGSILLQHDWFEVTQTTVTVCGLRYEGTHQVKVAKGIWCSVNDISGGVICG